MVLAQEAKQVTLPALSWQAETPAPWSERFPQAPALLPTELKELAAVEQTIHAQWWSPSKATAAALRRAVAASNIRPQILATLLRDGWRSGSAKVKKGKFFTKVTVPDPAGDYQMRVDCWVPAGYDPKRPWPLVVALHGTAGNSKNYINHWFMDKKNRWLHKGAPGLDKVLVVAPTSHRGHGWGPSRLGSASVWAAVRVLRQHYHIDPSRVYLSGCSMGGIGSRQLAVLWPERVAAVVQRSGPPWPIRDPRASGYRNLHQIGLLSYTGGKDQLIPRSAFADEIALVKNLPIPAQMHLFENRGHEIFYDKNAEALTFCQNYQSSPWPSHCYFASVEQGPGDRHYWLEIVKTNARKNPIRNLHVIDLRHRNDPIMQKIRSVRHGRERDSLYQQALKQGVVIEKREQWAYARKLEAEVDRKSNTIFLRDIEHIDELRIYLHDGLLDLDKVIVVKQGARTLFKNTVTRSTELMLDDLIDNGRRDRPAMAAIVVKPR